MLRAADNSTIAGRVGMERRHSSCVQSHTWLNGKADLCWGGVENALNRGLGRHHFFMGDFSCVHVFV